MTTAELLEQIKNIFSSDTALNTWCQQEFGRPPSVQIDVNEDQPPQPEEKYPIVAILGIRQIRGNSTRSQVWNLEIGVGLVQEEIVQSENTIIHKGFLQAETLRELAEDALVNARFAKVRFDGESAQINCYPMFTSYTTPTIEMWNTRRRR